MWRKPKKTPYFRQFFYRFLRKHGIIKAFRLSKTRKPACFFRCPTFPHYLHWMTVDDLISKLALHGFHFKHSNYCLVYRVFEKKMHPVLKLNFVKPVTFMSNIILYDSQHHLIPHRTILINWKSNLISSNSKFVSNLCVSQFQVLPSPPGNRRANFQKLPNPSLPRKFSGQIPGGRASLGYFILINFTLFQDFQDFTY